MIKFVLSVDLIIRKKSSMAIISDRYGTRDTDEIDKELQDAILEKIEEINIEAAKTAQLATTLIKRRDKLIMDSITKLIGDDWTISDLTGRGQFVLLSDKTEIFSFDNVPLIHFYHLRTEIDNSVIGINMKVTQDYKLLYNEE